MDNFLKIEIADNPYSRQQGLMYRKTLDNNSGMLFKFPKSEVLNFWGQNTYIHLDIAFVDENNKIIKIGKIKPFDLSSVSSEKECVYAIETNKDFFENNNIRIGDVIKIEKDTYNYPIIKFEKFNNITLREIMK